MTNYPRFSVAMSVYKNDKKEYLEQALRSVCDQTLLPDEVYVVIDGPIPDDLKETLERFNKTYAFFTFHHLSVNRGLGNALRIAIQNCKYDLVIRMDSDDISSPNRFETLIFEYLKEPADVIGSWTLGFFGDFENAAFSKYTNKLRDSDIKKALSRGSPVSHVSVLLNKKAVLESGNYQDLYYHEDYYLWARMIKNGCSFRNIPFFLVYVRCGADQAKRHGGLKYYRAERQLRRFMLSNGLISKASYFYQMFVRFVYMILLTPRVRSLVDRVFKRKFISKEEAQSIIDGNRLCIGFQK